jgi:hypothetical protein
VNDRRAIEAGVDSSSTVRVNWVPGACAAFSNTVSAWSVVVGGLGGTQGLSLGALPRRASDSWGPGSLDREDRLCPRPDCFACSCTAALLRSAEGNRSRSHSIREPRRHVLRRRHRPNGYVGRVGPRRHSLWRAARRLPRPDPFTRDVPLSEERSSTSSDPRRDAQRRLERHVGDAPRPRWARAHRDGVATHFDRATRAACTSVRSLRHGECRPCPRCLAQRNAGRPGAAHPRAIVFEERPGRRNRLSVLA